MITLGVFLEEGRMRYPTLKDKKFIMVDKKGKFIRLSTFDDLDFADREIIELKDLPNELVDDVYLIKLKISQRRYWKLMEK